MGENCVLTPAKRKEIEDEIAKLNLKFIRFYFEYFE